MAIKKAPSTRKPRAAAVRLPSPDVPIVGIGASAGGLEALEAFLGGVPAGSGLGFVVIQHLDPTHEAMLAVLLQRRTSMPVVEAADGIRVEPDHVYVIPPNKDMSVLHGALQLFPPAAPRGLRLPVDYFFRTLAEDRGERSVAVVLSGMGTDGALGVKAIKEAGGIVLVQEPGESKFDGMPGAAIQTGLCDVVAPAAQLCGRLLALLAYPALARTSEPPLPDDSMANGLEKVLILLRSRTGQDFSSYKPSTLYRRIERRMGVHQLPKIALYLRFLQENPEELDLLFKELLIGVTSFFRDPEAWEFLAREALPPLIRACPEGSTLRAWTPGCSTGEEAYSLGMVMRETIERLRPAARLGVQIFATDLDAAAIQQARQGIYPPNIAADVSPERLARFFVEEEGAAGGVRSGHYRIAKEIRERVTLAPQNVLADPPFTRLHLIVCRNLLIYLGPEAQKRLFAIFHYSLLPGGILFLGSAETVGAAQDRFAPLDAKLRIFRRQEVPRLGAVPDAPAVASSDAAAPSGRADDRPRGTGSLQSLAEQFLVQHFSPAAVLVNAAGDILWVSGRTGKYLEPATGKANFNLFAMAREGLRHELPRFLQQAARTGEAVVVRGLKIRTNGDFQHVDVTVQQLDLAPHLRGGFFVVFSDQRTPVERTTRGSKARKAGGTRAGEHEAELRRLREELLVTQQEMQASREQLHSSNEELQSANEELQSTNEELTTSKEEMQSLNEELQTVNAELQAKLDELLLANNDMKNLLDSTEIATLFLDGALNVRRFTTQTTRIFKLIAGDIGRPITDIVTDLDYPGLRADVEEVLRTLLSIEKEVATRDGRWFSVRVMPYRTVDNLIDGVVLTFSEVTAAKRLESELRRLGGLR